MNPEPAAVSGVIVFVKPVTDDDMRKILQPQKAVLENSFDVDADLITFFANPADGVHLK